MTPFPWEAAEVVGETVVDASTRTGVSTWDLMLAAERALLLGSASSRGATALPVAVWTRLALTVWSKRRRREHPSLRLRQRRAA